MKRVNMLIVLYISGEVWLINACFCLLRRSNFVPPTSPGGRTVSTIARFLALSRDDSLHIFPLFVITVQSEEYSENTFLFSLYSLPMKRVNMLIVLYISGEVWLINACFCLLRRSNFFFCPQRPPATSTFWYYAETSSST